jgi:RNA ligase
MFYEFPADLTLDEVRAVVAEHNEALGVSAFIEADRGDHVIFNYLVSFDGLFPQPDGVDPAIDRKRAIMRELRGLIMCPKTGDVLARRYQKFFNVNEKSFTQDHLIDWTQPHVVLDKLDGSMITPFITGGAIRFGTKMGLTDQAAQAEAHTLIRPQYERLSRYCIETGQTPIFEWCSRDMRIVIDYPEDKLVLTAIRNNFTGAYRSLEDLRHFGATYDIPVVGALASGVGEIKEFLASTRALKGTEGYVIRFDNGHMLKVKAEEYCRIHATHDALRWEKDVWKMVLEETIDDVIPYMLPTDRERVDAFVTAFDTAIMVQATYLTGIVAGMSANCPTKKDFALALNARTDLADVRSLLFAIEGGRDPVKVVRAHLAKNVSSSTKLESVRDLVGGIRWKDFYGHHVENDD